MTYPPSPYGGHPAPYGGHPGQGQPYAAPQQYGPPPQWQPPFAPPSPVPPPRKNKNTPLIVILAVVLVVLVGGGVSAWALWPGARGAAEAKSAKPSLHGRSAEELGKGLPGLQDMPSGWTESDFGIAGMGGGKADPEECGHILNGVVPVAEKHYTNLADHAESGIEAYLFEWKKEPSLEGVDKFIKQCATYKRTTLGDNGAPEMVQNITVHEVQPPQSAADASSGYEESGTRTMVASGTTAPSAVERSYLASVRGLFLYLYCRNPSKFEDKCKDVYVRTVNKFANMD